MSLRRVATAVFVFFAATSSLLAGYRISSWIPGWGPENLNSTQVNAGRMTESNPTWYRFNSDGTLAKKTASEDPTWRAAMTGTELLPAIQNTTSSGFDKALAVSVLSTAASRETHAQQILQLVLAQSYDGIDIDYERVPATSKENFTAFVSVLATKLHTYGKKLSVTVYAKTSDSATWDGPGGQDYAAIGALADWVKIMAYDYSYDGSAAGAITPIGWLDQVLAYATSKIPASKIQVGLPFYGYDWQGTSATGVTYAQAVATATSNAATIMHDVNGEATYVYGNRRVYFQDAFAYNRKVDLILEKYSGIAGFAHWANGQEDPAVWQRIEALKNGTVTPPPPPPPPPTPPVPTPTSGTLIPLGASWRYLDNGSDQGTAWSAVAFDDSAWVSGNAELGYGEGDEATVVGYGPSSTNKYVTTYLRNSFQLTSPSFTSLKIRLKRDDGAVVYINGTEAVRSNMPTGLIGYRTYAAGDATDESAFYEFTVSPQTLISGTNVVAVELHQSTPGSSDISFNLELIASSGMPAPSALTATAISRSQIDLAWSDNSTDETGFAIERCTGSTCTNFAPLATVAANVKTFSDTGLSRRTSYRYRVLAVKTGSTSEPSNIATERTNK